MMHDTSWWSLITESAFVDTICILIIRCQEKVLMIVTSVFTHNNSDIFFYYTYAEHT